MAWGANEAATRSDELSEPGPVVRPRSMALVGLGVLVMSMMVFIRVPLLPAIGRELSMSAAQLGLFTTVFAVGRLASDIPVGRLADRRTAAWLMACAAGVVAVGSVVLATAPTRGMVLAAALLLGIASSMTNTTGMTYFSTNVRADRRGSAMAAFSAALLGGQALGPAVGGLLASLGTWRTAAGVAGIVGLVMVVAIVAGSWTGQATTAGRAAARHEGLTADVQLPLGERTLLYAVPFTMFFTLGSMPQTLVPVIGAANFGLTASAIGLALGLGGMCRFAGALIGGVVSDRVSRKAALVPALVGQAAGVALLAVRGGVWMWVTAIAVMSLASFAVPVAATMLADRSGGRRVGRRLGTFRFVGDAGLIAGPLIAASIFQHVGQRAAVLTVAGLLAACAVASAFGLRETRWLSKETV